MKFKKGLVVLVAASCATVVLGSECVDSKGDSPVTISESHSNKYDPNYDTIFFKGKEFQDRVHKIEITISAENWEAMWSNLDDTFSSVIPQMEDGGGMMPPMGEMGEMSEMTDSMAMAMMQQRGGGGMMPPMGGGMMPPMGEMGEGVAEMGERGAIKDPLSSVDISPVWSPCTFVLNGEQWDQVGVRFKGNSSLMQSYMMGNDKLSMKLDFDHYEDDYPELKNQRCYGFKQLNLNNNYNDASYMREKVVSDMLRDFGLVSAHTAFCEVYLDYGEGMKYVGMYTIVEEVDDTVVEDQFGDGSGYLYKPEERAGSFAEGTYNEEEFNLKSKARSGDFEDVKALYDILNCSLRVENQDSWCEKLESVFDVDVFLKWLALNTSIQNWDTYGSMAHNYFLYNNPQNGKLTWISWDHNEALQSRPNLYTPENLIQAGDSWPLITYLLEVKGYKSRFDGYLKDFITGVFESTRVQAIYDRYVELLGDLAESEPSSVGGGGFMPNFSMGFQSAVDMLKEQVSTQNKAINSYLKL